MHLYLDQFIDTILIQLKQELTNIKYPIRIKYLFAGPRINTHNNNNNKINKLEHATTLDHTTKQETERLALFHPTCTSSTYNDNYPFFPFFF